jgi:hypothetical protein
LAILTALHTEHCAEYPGLTRALPPGHGSRIADTPFLPVRLFKHYALRSVPVADVVKTVTSSGTGNQAVSRIFLDRDNARAQTLALSRIVQDFIGPKRLPMLIVDTPSAIASRSTLSARGAGIVGMSMFGRDHVYALKDDLSLDVAALEALSERHGETPMLAFGFTFIVWAHFVRELEHASRRVHLPGTILLHSGGWKKLADQSVDDAEFRRRLHAASGIERVHNYYGMAEQIGSIFVACDRGVLHCPSFADVIVRDPQDWSECPHGREGIVQVLSALPTSYPGHSLLTEDIGVVLGEDDCACGRLGKTFAVRGRIPTSEVRGCSDTHDAAGAGR